MRRTIRRLAKKATTASYNKYDIILKGYLVVAILYGFAIESLIIKEQ